MKHITKYIKESASVFDDVYDPYRSYAIAYIKYFDGDKKFGEVVAGDTIYVYHYNFDKIIEVKAINKVIGRGANKYLPIDGIDISKNEKLKKLVFGPRYASWMGRGESYHPDQVQDTSVCVLFDKSMVFGTNKDNVLNIAKSGIGEQIEEVSKDIEKLNDRINQLKEKLDNLQ